MNNFEENQMATQLEIKCPLFGIVYISNQNC